MAGMTRDRNHPLSRPLAIAGLAFALAITLGANALSAQTFSVLYEFTGVPDGQQPSAPLTFDSYGNLYGTTSYGGSLSCNSIPPTGCGISFRLDPAGNETILHTFTGNPDGEEPFSGLIAGGQGKAYGMTYYGGKRYQGTVYRTDPNGDVTVIHNFASTPDGANPYLTSLARDAAGNLYGTTTYGGDQLLGLICLGTGCGTVFKIDPAGHETILYPFTDSAGDGAEPEAGVILDSAGNLYGATFFGGGAPCGTYGCGTIFKLSPTGEETVLYSFTGGSEGANPAGTLVRDEAGNLYGTTAYGGVGCDLNGLGCGAVFKLSPSGQITVLHTFTGVPDGANPFGGLVLDSQGNGYGVTLGGGDSSCSTDFGSGCGTVYKISRTGAITILHTFDQTDGSSPSASLLLDSAGNIYGTTELGGNPVCTYGEPPSVGCGVVFKIAP